MQFEREIRHLLIVFCVGFLAIALSASYWAIVGPENLALRNDNPRLVEREANIRRGRIYDRAERIVAQTILNDNGRLMRVYPYPQSGSALGYFSLRYGTSGAENAYNPILRGDTTPKSFWVRFEQDVLHRPQIGWDIQLSLDMELQSELTQALSGRQGAAVIIEVPSGALLAMVSLPTYDPGQLDEQWDNLINTDGNPFFNRVLQGNYQPGGFWQTALMAEAILAQYPLNQKVANATQPVVIDGLSLHCARQPSASDLTLSEAYAYGCPYPFTTLIEALGENALWSTLNTFQLSNYTLAGYISGDVILGEAETTPEPPKTEIIIETILGQGQQTITPLAMVMVAGAIINEGNAPQPYTLAAIRPPTVAEWQPASPMKPAVPLMTAETAEALRELTRQNIAHFALANPVGGHVSYAYSGDKQHVIFIGWGQNETASIAIAMVIENEADAEVVMNLGKAALEKALN